MTLERIVLSEPFLGQGQEVNPLERQYHDYERKLGADRCPVVLIVIHLGEEGDEHLIVKANSFVLVVCKS